MTAAFSVRLFGDLIPGKYRHGGYDLSRLASTLMLSAGCLRCPMGVRVEYNFLFSLFGAIFNQDRHGRMFLILARGLTGRVASGPGFVGGVIRAPYWAHYRQRGGKML